MICRDLKLLSDSKGDWVLSLSLTNKMDVRTLQELIEVELLDLTLKKHRNKRTLTQNAYLWVLCNEIAKKVSSTKVKVYRDSIRAVGVSSDRDINNDDIIFFIKSWRKQGEGFVCDKMITKPNEFQTTIRFYQGSSEYDTEEMARLIDEIVTSAKDLGIDTMSTEEVGRLKR